MPAARNFLSYNSRRMIASASPMSCFVYPLKRSGYCVDNGGIRARWHTGA